MKKLLSILLMVTILAISTNIKAEASYDQVPRIMKTFSFTIEK